MWKEERAQQNTQELHHWIVLEVSDYGVFAASREAVTPRISQQPFSLHLPLLRATKSRVSREGAKPRSSDERRTILATLGLKAQSVQ